MSIYPSRIFEHFASVLTIAGQRFEPGVDIRCSFGSGDITEASWIDTSTITCLSPKLSMGNYSVYLMSSVNVIGSAPVPLEVIRKAQLTDLQPASAIAGAIVTIFGGNFLTLSAQVECVFDNISVLTRSIEESKVTCVVPDLRGKEVDVSLASNGQLVSIGLLRLKIVSCSVSFMQPSAGPQAGGSVMTVAGIFPTDAPFRCTFGMNPTVHASQTTGRARSTILFADLIF